MNKPLFWVAFLFRLHRHLLKDTHLAVCITYLIGFILYYATLSVIVIYLLVRLGFHISSCKWGKYHLIGVIDYSTNLVYIYLFPLACSKQLQLLIKKTENK